MYFADSFACHTLSGLDCGAQRFLCKVHIDHGAGFNTARDLMANAYHTGCIVGHNARDEAADLGTPKI
jgi:hypothetical protein